tara:strand:+ start:3264 stop:3659 length:396 start_codon:yes stop_codon:yes gene_type:complete
MLKARTEKNGAKVQVIQTHSRKVIGWLCCVVLAGLSMGCVRKSSTTIANKQTVRRTTNTKVQKSKKRTSPIKRLVLKRVIKPLEPKPKNRSRFKLVREGNSIAAIVAKGKKAPPAPNEKRCKINFKITGMT